jgi:enoyl-CoA hydratase
MAVTIERNGRVAVVTMRRPEAFNAFNSEQLNAMLAAVQELSLDRGTRAVVLTGEGRRAFASGADIKEMSEKSVSEALTFARLGHEVATTIATAPQPWIAAVNGFALGGGCEVAVACDMRIASENSVFGQPEVGLGVTPGWGGTQRLPRLIGAGLASEMIFTGRRLNAEEALRVGLISAVYSQDDLLPKAFELAETIAANAPVAVAAAKRAIAMIYDADLAAGLAFEEQSLALCFDTADQTEGMHAFIEKRKPEFRGN